jgi:hypothetical protein
VAKKSKPTPEPQEDREVVTLPKKSVLTELLKAGRFAFKKGREIAGDFGAMVKDGVANEHVHRKALAACRAADRMEPAQLAEFFYHRDHYEKIFGLRERADSAPRFDLGGEPSESEPEAEGDQEGAAAVH